MSTPNEILKVNGLSTVFKTKYGIVHAVEDISFSVFEGEMLGIVGESGSGKSVTSLSILRLIRAPGEIAAGEILYNGKDILKMDTGELCAMRGSEIAMIFQEPLSSLNPSFTVGWQIAEAYRLHSRMSADEIREKTIRVLEDVKIPDPAKRLNDYPHQFSGGMRQRVLIAIALACRPKILIADEPTTALDVTVQAEIMDLLVELKDRFNLTVIFISHNLNLVGERCDRIAVMYAGRILEVAATDELFANPCHPYTEGLLQAIPSNARRNERLVAIPGDVPVFMENVSRCIFRERCRYAADRCGGCEPELVDIGKNHLCRCYREIAPFSGR